MAKSRTRSREAPEEPAKEITEDKKTLAVDNTTSPPAKQPASLAPQPVDREPRLTIHAFTRGSKDPILRAFAHHEKLAHETRKLTRAQWESEYETFLGVGR